MKDKPIYVPPNLHKTLKSYAKKKGSMLKFVTESVIIAGLKALKIK